MPLETIKTLLENQSIFQKAWLFIFVAVLAFIRVLYIEIKGGYKVFRSLVLSVGAGMMAGIFCYHFEFPFLVILMVTGTVSFMGEKFWDWLVDFSKDFGRNFKDILIKMLTKGK